MRHPDPRSAHYDYPRLASAAQERYDAGPSRFKDNEECRVLDELDALRAEVAKWRRMDVSGPEVFAGRLCAHHVNRFVEIGGEWARIAVVNHKTSNEVMVVTEGATGMRTQHVLPLDALLYVLDEAPAGERARGARRPRRMRRAS